MGVAATALAKTLEIQTFVHPCQPNAMGDREKNVYFAKLAEQAERYDEMADYMEKETSKGNNEQAGFAKEYCGKVEAELQKICDTILKLLDGNLISKDSSGESQVFYQKMKADYYRYIAEFTADDAKAKAADNARLAYEEAQKVAEKDLAV